LSDSRSTKNSSPTLALRGRAAAFGQEVLAPRVRCRAGLSGALGEEGDEGEADGGDVFAA
jgi:hypothetical protein